MRNQRTILVVLTTVLALVGMPVIAAAQTTTPKPTVTGPLALVYRGPASVPGTAESVAVMLRNSPSHFRTEYVGPNDTPITAATLARATVFAQPGGPSLSRAWKAMSPYSGLIRDWISKGGNYLGFCVGGYLAGATPGYDLLPGDTSQYSAKPGATVWDTLPHRSTVVWRGQEKTTYFQDPPAFDLEPGHSATILGTYKGGEIAALAVDFGKGRVGVTGPHIEADASWFVGDGLSAENAVHMDLAYDLVETTVRGNQTLSTAAPATTLVTTPPAPTPTTTPAPETTPAAPTAPVMVVSPVTTAPPVVAVPPATTTPTRPAAPVVTIPPTTTAPVTTVPPMPAMPSPPQRPPLPWPLNELAANPLLGQILQPLVPADSPMVRPAS